MSYVEWNEIRSSCHLSWEEWQELRDKGLVKRPVDFYEIQRYDSAQRRKRRIRELPLNGESH